MLRNSDEFDVARTVATPDAIEPVRSISSSADMACLPRGSGVASWTYRGVLIATDRTGAFCGRLNGIALSEHSLDGIKQKIDALLIFGPFLALYLCGCEVRHLTIVGIKITQHGRQWIDKSKALHRHVLRNTPENAAKLEAYLKARTAESVRIENERKRIAALLDHLPWELPDTDTPKGLGA
jgi:hypothetical protein